MSLIFAACQKFAARCGDSWTRYIGWSGHQHIREVVSADSMLCPTLIDGLIDEDWDFNVHEDNRVHLFRDYQYLIRRIRYDESRHNILAIIEHPEHAVALPPGFTFCGYDIIDSYDSISVLLNCGAFPSIFTSSELNESGLLSALDRASTIANTLRMDHAGDSHCCDCRVWGMARYKTAA